MVRDIDWYGDDVAVPQQHAITVYVEHGNIVIRQKNPNDGIYDRDPEIIVAPHNVLKVTHAILSSVGLGDFKLYQEWVSDYGLGCGQDLDWNDDISGLVEVSTKGETAQKDRTAADKVKPKDPTAAERKRRSREKKRRDSDPNTNRDTGRDG